jgi:crossover junction endonuclease MUS81
MQDACLSLALLPFDTTMAEEREDIKPLIKKAIDSLLQHAKTHNLKARYNYMKAKRALDASAEPIYTLAEASRIKCIGDKTTERIQEYMSTAEGQRSAPYIRAEVIPAKERSARPSAKRYIPGYRTAAYAILRALWVKEGVTKHAIAYRAKDHCDGDFDLQMKHSAMSSLKTLIGRKLVFREDKHRYYLTEEGKNLASAMFADASLTGPENSSVMLVTDSREMKHRRCRSFFQTHFEEKGIRHETRMLDLGDFVWIRNERLCGFIIERKQGSDFASSIIDGRFKEQKQRLMNSGIKRMFYIVEGLKPVHMQQVGYELASSCLTRSKLEGFTVIETENIRETSEVICLVDSFVRARYDARPLDICEDSDSSNSLELSYASFIDRGGKGCSRNVKYLLYLALLSVRGVNHAKAEALSDRYKSIFNFIEQSKREDFIQELQQLEVDGKKLPKKNINDIVALLSERDFPDGSVY